MSKLPPENKTVYHCRVCGNRLSLKSLRQTIKHNIFKTTKCCNKYCPLHIKCVNKLSHVMDASYQFDASTYGDDDTMPLYCFVCEKNAFIVVRRI